MKFLKTPVVVAEEEDLLVVEIAIEVAEEAVEAILNLEEAIVLLNLEEEDLIDLINLHFQEMTANLLKVQAQEEALSLVILEVLVHLQEEEEAEKRTSLVL